MDAATHNAVERAAHAIAEADGVLVTAGAGMGVDSGLPDFRGAQGFWRAYPVYEHLGLSFSDLANPAWFRRDPELAWGFYGHRLGLYRETRPHEGFALLQRLIGGRSRFVFTSNVDGQFQAAGWSDAELFEVHGSIHWMQCSGPCSDAVWDGAAVQVAVDPETFRARGPLPTCGACRRVARPNILMFGDYGFVSDRCEEQAQAFDAWIATVRRGALTIIELGAGTGVPTVRRQGEHLQSGLGATLVRINPREGQGPPGTISLPWGALHALRLLDEAL